VPRPRKKVDTSTYPGRVAQSLHELRTSKKWTVGDLQQRLADEGCELSQQSLYAYENGDREVPLEIIPVVATIFGYKTATGWLPID